jgi:hypothetical protein
MPIRRDLEEVAEIGPISSTLIRLVKEMCAAYLAEKIKGREVLSSPQAVLDFARMKLSGLPHEAFMVVFLNAKNRVLDYKILQEGTVDRAVIYPRRIIEEALARHAAGIIFVHNHPAAGCLDLALQKIQVRPLADGVDNDVAWNDGLGARDDVKIEFPSTKPRKSTLTVRTPVILPSLFVISRKFLPGITSIPSSRQSRTSQSWASIFPSPSRQVIPTQLAPSRRRRHAGRERSLGCRSGTGLPAEQAGGAADWGNRPPTRYFRPSATSGRNTKNTSRISIVRRWSVHP